VPVEQFALEVSEMLGIPAHDLDVHHRSRHHRHLLGSSGLALRRGRLAFTFRRQRYRLLRTFVRLPRPLAEVVDPRRWLG
jgi:hypothetical protein